MSYDEILRQLQADKEAQQREQNENPAFKPSSNDTPRIRAMKERLQKKNIARQEQKAKDNQLKQALKDARGAVSPIAQAKTGIDAIAGQSSGESNPAGIDQTAFENMSVGSANADAGKATMNSEASEYETDVIYQGLMDRASDNFIAGMSDWVGSFGDVFNAVGAMSNINTWSEGNFISRMLNEYAEDIGEDTVGYIPPELRDPELSLSTFFNPQFWATHGARFTPQLIEVLATLGEGAMIKKGIVSGIEKYAGKRFAQEIAENLAEKGLSKAALRASGREAVKESGESAAKAGLVKTVENMGESRAVSGAVHELDKGRGIGRLIRDTGEASNAARALANGTADVAAGITTNLRTSLANAGDTYRTYKEMKNEDGSQMFTEDELANMSAGTFYNNMNYMMMDIMSWSMTYGGGQAAMKKLGKSVTSSSIGKAFASKAENIKNAGVALSKQTGPVFDKILTSVANKGGKIYNNTRGLQKWAATAAKEGIEESVQEVYEEWSRLKAYEEATGSVVHYQNDAKKYKDSFFDFYMSKEMEGTRTIAGFLGAGAGGMFNMRTIVDNSANKAHEFTTRAELLKGSIKGDMMAKERQTREAWNVMSELVFQGKESYATGVINDFIEKGIVTEEQAQDMVSQLHEAIEQREHTNKLNISGKKAYFSNLRHRTLNERQMTETEQKRAEEIKNIEDQFGPDENLSESDLAKKTKLIEDKNRVYDLKVKNLEMLGEDIDNNIKNLLAGEPASIIKIKGKTYKGVDFLFNVAEGKNNPYDDTDEVSLEDDEEGEVDERDPHISRLINRAKKWASKIKNKVASVFNKKENMDLDEDSKPTIDEEGDVSPAEYKKGGELKSYNNSLKIQARANEVQSELARLNQEEVKAADAKDDAKVKSIKKAKAELEQELQDLNDRESKILDQELKDSEQGIFYEEGDDIFLDEEKELQDDIKNLMSGENTNTSKPNSSVAKKQTEDDSIADLFDDPDFREMRRDKSTSEKVGNKIKETTGKAAKATDQKLNRIKKKDALKRKNGKYQKEVKERYDKDVARIEELREKASNTQDVDELKSIYQEIDSISADLLEYVDSVDSKYKADEEASKNEVDPEKGVVEKTLDKAGNKARSTMKVIGNGFKKGKSAIVNAFRDSTAYGNRTAWNAELSHSMKFGNDLVARLEVINNSGLWNGKEKPDVVYVNDLYRNKKNEKGEETTFTRNTPAIYLPLVNTILIDGENWNNDAAYHHEFLHMNYAYGKNTPEMKEYLTKMKQLYPELYDKIKNRYRDGLVYSVPATLVNRANGREARAAFKVLKETDPDYNQLFADKAKVLFGENVQFPLSKMDRTKVDNALYKDFIGVDSIKMNRASVNAFMGKDPFSDEAFEQIKSEYDGVELLPDEEQDLVNEEFFVETQEGARAKKYNVYMEEKPAHQEARKNFWRKLLDRFKKVFKSKADMEKNILENLEDKDFLEYTDPSSAIWKKFTEEFTPGSIDADVREKRRSSREAREAKRYSEVLDAVQKDAKPLPKEEDAYVTDENGNVYIDFDKVPSEYAEAESIDVSLEKDESRTDSEDDSDTISDGFFSDTKNAFDLTLTKVISGPINYILKQSSLVEAELGNKVKRRYDVDVLHAELFAHAKESADVVDFIMSLEQSEIPEVKIFLKTLDVQTRKNNIAKKEGKAFDNKLTKENVLKSYFAINANKHKLTPVMTVISKSGKVYTTDSVTARLASRINQTHGLNLQRGYRKSGKGRLQFAAYAQAMEHIRTTPINQIESEAVINALQFFGDKSVDYRKIYEGGYLVVNGQNVPLVTALKAIANRMFEGRYDFQGQKTDGIYVTKGRNTPYVKARDVNYTDASKYHYYGIYPSIKPVVEGRLNKNKTGKKSDFVRFENPHYKTLTRAVFVTDATNKNVNSYLNAEGQLSNAKSMSNAVLAMAEKMNQEVMFGMDNKNPMSEAKFINKYSNIAAKKGGKGSKSNPMLRHFYKLASSGRGINITPHYGVRNDATFDAKTMKNQTPIEDSMVSAALFADKYHTGSFMMDMGRFSASNQKFLVNAPILKNVIKNGKVDSKAPELLHATIIYNNQNDTDITPEEYASAIDEAIAEHIANAESFAPTLVYKMPMYELNEDGKISDKSKKLIAEYVVSSELNGMALNEVVLPGFKFAKNTLIKRSASASTTMIPLKENVKHETLYFNDGSVDNVDTDGAAYILEEDLHKINNSMGGFVQMNGHVKMANVGVSHTGPEGYKGTIYDKPLYVALSEKFVEQHPKLKPLRELMLQRKAKWEAQNGKGSEDYGDGQDNHLITAVSLSADKTKNPVKKANAIDLNNLNESYAQKASREAEGIESTDDSKSYHDDVNETLDNLYYPNGKFNGYSGENIGVQIVMNNNLSNNGLSSQMIGFLTTGMEGDGSFDSENPSSTVSPLMRAQNLIYEQARDNIRTFTETITNGTLDELKELVLESNLFDKDAMDPIARKLLFDDKLSLATPNAMNLVRNTLIQQLAKKGNRLSTAGTQARVVPSAFYEKSLTLDGQNYPIYEVDMSYADSKDGEYLPLNKKGNSGLNDYTYIQQKTKDGYVKTYRPAEIVAPASMSKKVRKREYMISWDGNMSKNGKAYRKALAKAKSLGLKESDIRMFEFNNGPEGMHGGFFIPGETITATRIPSHGPQSTGVFEVVDFDRTGASQTLVPKRFTKVTGQDHDGDTLFINHKDKNMPKWNKALDLIEQEWLTERMQNELDKELDFDVKAEEAIDFIYDLYPEWNKSSTTLMYTPEGRMEQFNNTLMSKGNIGGVMSLHRTYRLFADHKVSIKDPVEINGKMYNSFADQDGQGISRTIESANIANMILDDLSHGFARKLGINRHTLKYVMPLVNMGVPLGEIGVIMRSPIMEKWVKLNENNSNLFTESSYFNQNAKSTENMKELLGEKLANSKINGTIDIKNIDSDSSKVGIINLISTLSRLQNEAHVVSNIIKGHRDLEGDPFIGNEDLAAFDKLMNGVPVDRNGVENIINITPLFKNSPLLSNYKRNAVTAVKLGRKLELAYNNSTQRIWNGIVTNNPRSISAESKAIFLDNMQKTVLANTMGLTGVESKNYVDSLFQKDNPNNIFDRLNTYANQIVPGGDTSDVNALRNKDVSLLFSKALNMNLSGEQDMRFIRFNGSLVGEDVHPQLVDYARKAFAELPTDLQNDMMIYDLVANGFRGNSSLSILFNQDQLTAIDNAVNSSSTEGVVDNRVYMESVDNMVLDNPDNFTVKTKGIVLSDTNGNIVFNKKNELNPENKAVWDRIKRAVTKNKTAVYFQDVSMDGKTKKVYKVLPFNEADVAYINSAKDDPNFTADFYGEANPTLAQEDAVVNERLKAKVKLVSRAGGGTRKSSNVSSVKKGGSSTLLSEYINNKNNNNSDNIFSDQDFREKRTDNDYQNYERFLSEGEFYSAMGMPTNISNKDLQNLYAEYSAQKVDADRVSKVLTPEFLSKVTTNALYELYGSHRLSQSLAKRVGIDSGVGLKNKLAYSEVLGKVTREFSRRAAQEQADLINQNNPNAKYDVKGKGGKDMSVIDSWMIASNVSSNDPALQTAIRKAKATEKEFLKEKSRLMKDLNKVTSELYKSKLGFDPYDGFTGKLKHIYHKVKNMFNQSNVMKELYGNLIYQEKVQLENGQVIDNMRYHSKELMLEKLKNGEITQAEYNFYKVTSDMMADFQPYMAGSEGKSRDGYIPHVAPALAEAYSRNGMLGIMQSLRTVDEEIGDVKVMYNGKLTPYNEAVMSLSLAEGNKNKAAAELYKMKVKATKLLAKGHNEDGSPIIATDTSVGSALGDTFMNAFTGTRGIKATLLPSWDLNKAFGEYIHGALFSTGNANFKGFKQLLPLFDGIISHSLKNNKPNTAKYVKKVWKDYFLARTKQSSFKTPAHIKALGMTSDGAIDLITKGSLFYWLGYKGLAVGNGIYAIGNVLIGKYNNIKEVGHKDWIKGEKRFWKGNEPFDILNPFKGVKNAMKILKKTGFMEINLYDDVPINNLNTVGSLFGDIALLPMLWSEKWIQGVQFLGNLTDEEFDRLANEENYTLETNRMTEIESSITAVHGRGYQTTDQRMIQMYSWGRMMMQFSRWIPTSVSNLFAKKDFDIYGQEYEGYYRKYGKILSRFMTGELSPKKFKEYYNSLGDNEKKKLQGALAGFGIMSVAAVGGLAGFQPANKLFWDANVFADFDKLGNKAVPPAVAMFQ